MRISKETAEKVKALRSATDKKGKPLSITQISIRTKLKPRQVKFILYEKGNQRINDLKYKWLWERRHPQALSNSLQQSTTPTIQSTSIKR